MSFIIDPVAHAFAFRRPAVQLEKDLYGREEMQVPRKSVLALRIGAVAAVVMVPLIGVLTRTMMTMVRGAYPLIAIMGVPALAYFVALRVLFRFGQFESRRASAAVEEDAVARFQNDETISSKVMGYMIRSPNAVVQLGRLPNACLEKKDAEGLTLFEHLCRSSYQPIVMKALVDQLIDKKKFTFLHFSKILVHYPDLIASILEKKGIDAASLTPTEQYHCLSRSPSQKWPIFAQNGFDMDAPSEAGISLLLTLLLERNTQTQEITRLLACGAKVPTDDEQIPLGEGNKTLRMHLEQSHSELERKFLDRIFAQARKLKGNLVSPDSPTRVARWNLFQPAIADSLTYRHWLDERIQGIALLLLYGIGMLCLGTNSALPAIGLVALPFYFLYEHSRTKQALREVAKKRFEDPLFPDHSTISYILGDAYLLNQVDRQDVFFKVTENGQTLFEALLSQPYNANIRGEIDRLFAQELSPDEKKACLASLAQSDGPYRKYVLERHFITQEERDPSTPCGGVERAVAECTGVS